MRLCPCNTAAVPLLSFYIQCTKVIFLLPSSVLFSPHSGDMPRYRISLSLSSSRSSYVLTITPEKRGGDFLLFFFFVLRLPQRGRGTEHKTTGKERESRTKENVRKSGGDFTLPPPIGVKLSKFSWEGKMVLIIYFEEFSTAYVANLILLLGGSF